MVGSVASNGTSPEPKVKKKFYSIVELIPKFSILFLISFCFTSGLSRTMGCMVEGWGFGTDFENILIKNYNIIKLNMLSVLSAVAKPLLNVGKSVISSLVPALKSSIGSSLVSAVAPSIAGAMAKHGIAPDKYTQEDFKRKLKRAQRRKLENIQRIDDDRQYSPPPVKQKPSKYIKKAQKRVSFAPLPKKRNYLKQRN